MTFLQLAEKILHESSTPLTATEIWEIAISKGYDKELAGQGKTPWATLGAQIYVNSKNNPKNRFSQTDSRPKRFYLKGEEFKIEKTSPKEDLEKKKNAKKFDFLEKDIHQPLSYFAYYHLNLYTKTINHNGSSKKEFGEWVHPDMVGCYFPLEDWKSEVYELSSAIGNISVKLVSFEIKRELNFGNLRESFFQTVSNSSWANESYLVATKVAQESDFLEELSRLSTSFGIGIIEINMQDVDSSSIIFPSRKRDSLDWETINKLAFNPDFREFLTIIRIDSTSKRIQKKEYDPVIAQKVNELN